ncbi:response regulator [Kineococcus sp. SYSU DK005]|uniref:response regulator n=1 Tax=Kineococcus sp. SYSU DK005 TaxID=3383126 RepID=UPI003D7E8A03
MLTAGLLLAVTTLLLVGGSSYARIGALVDERGQVERTHARLDDVAELRVLLRDAERGQRGYLITGREYYLEPYDHAVERIRPAADALVAATAGTPDGAATGARLREAVEGKLAELSSTVRLRRERGFEAAQAVVGTDAGRTQMRRATAALDELEDAERIMLARQQEQVAASAARTRAVVLAGTAGAVLLLALGALWVDRRVVRPVQRMARAAQRLAEGEAVEADAGRAPREIAAVAQVVNTAVEALLTARDKAVEADRAKSAFLATMSHEVRTPMNAVIGMTDLLLDTPLDGQQRELAETVRDSGEALLVVIDEVLDYSQLQAGSLRLLDEPVEVRACVEGAAAVVRHEAGAKGLELVVDVGAEVPAVVRGDGARLHQVLVHLLQNAVVSTSRGEVALTVAAEPAGADGGEGPLRFAVRDTGAGVAAEDLEGLFTSFAPLDPYAPRAHRGVGLALAICSGLAEAMGGALAVRSAPGIGSTFTLRVALPATAGVPGAVRGVPPLTAADLAGRDVLVVDDNATNRRVLQLQLEGWGAACTSAASAGEALALVAAGRAFDAALLDMHMPGTDGEQLANALRALPAGRALPLVLLTSGHRHPSAAAGGVVDATLSKPVRTGLLESTLRDLLGGRPPVAGTAAGTVPAVAPAPTAPTAPLAPPAPGGVPARRLRVLLAEDNAVNQKVAQLLLARFGHDVDTVADGHQALEAVRAADYDVVLMDLHMPVLDGLQATRLIRSEVPAGRQPRIVALTASVLSEDRDACAAAGMDAHLTKPVRARELENALAAVLAAPAAAPRPGRVPAARPVAGGVAQDVATVTVEPPAPAVVPLEVAVRARIADLGGADTDADRLLFSQLLTSFVERAPQAVAGLELAVLSGDARALETLAHSLKGSAANLGADALAQRCADLEDRTRAGEPPADGSLAGLREELERTCRTFTALAGELAGAVAGTVAGTAAGVRADEPVGW